MKNIFSKILLVALGFTTIVSCSEPENVIYDVFDGVEYGAVLRTIEVISANYDKGDTNSAFEVTLEQQDEQYGGLFGSINVYATYVDASNVSDTTITDGDTTVATTRNLGEELVKNVASSAFTTGPTGLPRGTIATTLQEVLTAHSLVDGDFDAGDLITIRFELVLSDGRTFSAADGSGSLQGSYFASPYQYTAALLCKPLPGDYSVVMADSYGDGWQTNDGNGGDGIQVTVTLADGTTTVLEVGMCSPYGAAAGTFLGDGACTGPASTSFYNATGTITIPAGAEGMEWYFPGDQYGEISFEIYAPTGELLYTTGGVGAIGAGSLPVVRCET